MGLSLQKRVVNKQKREAAPICFLIHHKFNAISPLYYYYYYLLLLLLLFPCYEVFDGQKIVKKLSINSNN